MINKQNQVRIIGGQWRGRLLTFEDSQETALRPTPNRIRETLFNWLSSVIVGAQCLDAFGGSGALSFEALSRGAKQVSIVEKNISAVKSIQKNASLLKITPENNELHIIHQDALHYLAHTSETFDIIFLDPPFHENLLNTAMELITDRKLLRPTGFLYTESSAVLPTTIINNPWISYRSKKAGTVYYNLLKITH